MTEDEAKTKWCPFARVTDLDGRAMIPLTKQAAAIRHMRMILDTKKLAKASEAFKRAYHVDFNDACIEAQRTLETAREPA